MEVGWLRSWALKSLSLGLSTIFTKYKLCDSVQVTQLLCALSSYIDGRYNSAYFIVLWQLNKIMHKALGEVPGALEGSQ